MSMHNYKTGRYLLLLITIITIGTISCRSYKSLEEPPAMDAQGIVRNGDDNKGDTTTIANIPWKEYFTDPKLQVLIQEGLDKNVDMQIAITRIKEAEATLGMSRATNLPTLSVGATISYTRISSGANGTDVLGYNYSGNTNTLGFTASWEADLWGKLNYQTKAKYAAYLSSVEYKNLVQTELVANISNAYYTLMAYDEQLRITNETIELMKKSSETMESLKEAGQQNAASVEQSNALLYSTQLSVLVLESQIRKQEDAICLLLLRKPGSIDRTSICNQAVSERLAYGVPMQMLAKRPDVKQSELSVRSAYALTSAAKASFYPTFNISSASLGLASGYFSNFFKPENIAAAIVASLTQPIFNKKQLKGNLAIAQAQQEEALFTFQKTVLDAGAEVSDILYSYQLSLQKNEFRDKQIKSLTNAVDFTQLLLKAGEATYTEVLTAQQSFLSAQLSQVSDKLEQLSYSVSLYKALGGGVY